MRNSYRLTGTVHSTAFPSTYYDTLASAKSAPRRRKRPEAQLTILHLVLSKICLLLNYLQDICTSDDVLCTRVQSSTFWGSYSTDVVESRLLRHRLFQHGLCSAIVGSIIWLSHSYSLSVSNILKTAMANPMVTCQMKSCTWPWKGKVVVVT